METDVVTRNGLQPKGEEGENFTQMNCDLKWATILSRNKYTRLGIWPEINSQIICRLFSWLMNLLSGL